MILFDGHQGYRDMVADGLTKGSVSHTMFANLMQGSPKLAHAAREYQGPTTTTTTRSVIAGVEGGGYAFTFQHQPTSSSNFFLQRFKFSKEFLDLGDICLGMNN